MECLAVWVSKSVPFTHEFVIYFHFLGVLVCLKYTKVMSVDGLRFGQPSHVCPKAKTLKSLPFRTTWSHTFNKPQATYHLSHERVSFSSVPYLPPLRLIYWVRIHISSWGPCVSPIVLLTRRPFPRVLPPFESMHNQLQTEGDCCSPMYFWLRVAKSHGMLIYFSFFASST